MVADPLRAAIGELHRLLRIHRDALGEQRVREAHEAEPDRPVAQVRRPRLRNRVEVHVDHVVQHPHRGAGGAPQPLVVDAVDGDVPREVDRAEVADRDLVGAGVQRDLGAQVRRVHDPGVPLRRADVARVLERDPRVPGLEQRGEHPPPQVHRADLPEHPDLAALGGGLVVPVALGELRAEELVQVTDLVRGEQRPGAVGLHAAQELVRHPVRGVHVVRAAAVVAGVLAQVEELLDVDVPGLQV